MLDTRCSPSETGTEAIAATEQGIILAITPFSAPAALDRRSVGVQQGQVMRQATTWAWEDAPRRLVGQAIQDRLACSPQWNVLTPYRPRAEHDAVLGGRVEAFTVHQAGDAPEAGGTVRVRVVLDVWSQGKGPLVARVPLEASAPFAVLESQAVAMAANQALSQLLDDLMDALATVRPAIATSSLPE